MNEKQQQFLKDFILQNEMSFPLEGEWSDAKVVHSFQLEGLYKKLRALE